MSADHQHETSFNGYLKILMILFVLTGITVWISGFDMGVLSMPVAMFVATIKASFVMYYFMHLNHDSNLNRSMIFIGVFFLFVMFAISFADIATRVLHQSTL